ncbi:MAG: hypothetical protein J0M16_12020, partial [Gammaproteobacteria bacterium]|nr:hypothetical protein [Gammaproteobacteria bacterium]
VKVLVGEWQAKRAAQRARDQAFLEATIARYLERRTSYDAFRKSVCTLLDAMDQGTYAMGLLYEVRDQLFELRRLAPAEVIAAADRVIDALKPAIDKGPSDHSFVRITTTLRAFEDACRADAGLGAVSHRDKVADRGRRQVARQPARQSAATAGATTTSGVLDQSDDEARLTRIFFADDRVSTRALPGD